MNYIYGDGINFFLATKSDLPKTDGERTGLLGWGMEVEAPRLYHKSFFCLHLFFFFSSQPVRQCFLLRSIPG